MQSSSPLEEKPVQEAKNKEMVEKAKREYLSAHDGLFEGLLGRLKKGKDGDGGDAGGGADVM